MHIHVYRKQREERGGGWGEGRGGVAVTGGTAYPCHAYPEALDGSAVLFQDLPFSGDGNPITTPHISPHHHITHSPPHAHLTYHHLTHHTSPHRTCITHITNFMHLTHITTSHITHLITTSCISPPHTLQLPGSSPGQSQLSGSGGVVPATGNLISLSPDLTSPRYLCGTRL